MRIDDAIWELVIYQKVMLDYYFALAGVFLGVEFYVYTLYKGPCDCYQYGLN